MERFCGTIACANKSRRYPYSSINRRVLQVAQLSQIKLLYGLVEELDLGQRRENLATGMKYSGYSDLNFVNPKREHPIQGQLIRKAAHIIGQKFGIDEGAIQNSLADRPFVAWGKMQRIVRNDDGELVGGDLIRGHHITSSNEETCDATHYYSKKSCWRWDAGAAIDVDDEVISFGCAEQFLVIDVAFLREVSEQAGMFYPHLNPLIPAVVSPFPYLCYISESKIIQYRLRAGAYAAPEIVNASKIDCLVGRVITPLKASYIVERGAVVGRIDMLDEVIIPD